MATQALLLGYILASVLTLAPKTKTGWGWISAVFCSICTNAGYQQVILNPSNKKGCSSRNTKRQTYKRAVGQNDLRLVGGEVELDDVTVSVPVHHLWVWESKRWRVNATSSSEDKKGRKRWHTRKLEEAFWASLDANAEWTNCAR